MPSRNRVKPYLAGGFYHAYNRGVDKCTIFRDAQDYYVFIKFLMMVLQHPSPAFSGERRLKNYSQEIKLISFCLMPNHFHFLLQQLNDRSMPEFMRSLMTAYSMYFNKRHHRVGSLFQEAYKAVLIETDEQLIHTSRYINRNPLSLGSPPQSYQYSSYRTLRQNTSDGWVKPQPVLKLFKSVSDYEAFVADITVDSTQLLGALTIDGQECDLCPPQGHSSQGVTLNLTPNQVL